MGSSENPHMGVVDLFELEFLSDEPPPRGFFRVPDTIVCVHGKTSPKSSAPSADWLPLASRKSEPVCVASTLTPRLWIISTVLGAYTMATEHPVKSAAAATRAAARLKGQALR